MKVLVVLGILRLLSDVQAWALSPCKVKQIGRKAFVAGAAAGVVIGVSGVAGAVVAVDQAQKSRPAPYEVPSGSMVGKLVLITGGSSGLGLESAKRLGAAGATIVVTSRNISKGEKAVEDIKKYLKSREISDAKVYNLVLDLDDLDSVKSFPSSFEKLKLGKIDVLLNNAGVMAIPTLQFTKDGFERTFQSNHLGHFVLTAGLFPFLNQEKATVVNVASTAYTIAAGKGLELDNLNGEKQYGAWSSYGQSKLSNILFTQELQRRANAAGASWLTAVTLHPGVVQTDLARYTIGEEKWKDMKIEGPSGLEKILLNAVAFFLKTVEEGASTQVYLASGAEGALKKGAYYDDLKPQNLPAFAKDENKARLLWEQSEVWGGIKFGLGSESTKIQDSLSTEATTVET